MDLGAIGSVMNMAKSLTLTDEQKAVVKQVVKSCEGNKAKIQEELKKHNIPVSAEQIDAVIKLAEKL